MPRINRRPGDILRFPLSDSRFGFAQWLPDGTARIFEGAFDGDVPMEAVIASPVAFRVMVFRDTPGKHGWANVGRAAIPSECALPQRYAKKDPISGRLSVCFEGQEMPAEPRDIVGLETAAVWAHPHIVERLEAQLKGQPSQSLKSIQVNA